MSHYLSQRLSSALSLEDRQQFFQTLDLEQLHFYYLEASRDTCLRAAEWVATKKRSLTGREIPQLPLIQREIALPLVTKTTKPSSLWERLFPPPFHQLESLNFQPESFGAQWQRARTAFDNFETLLSETEVSCLWLQGRTQSLGLAFHFVRRQCLFLGLAPWLESMQSAFERSELKPEMLKEKFLTQSSFHSLDLRPFHPNLEGLALALEENATQRKQLVTFQIRPTADSLESIEVVNPA